MIEHISLDGVEYPFLFSIRASAEAGKIPSDNEFGQALKMVYLGFKYGAKAEGKDPPEFEKLVGIFDLHPEELIKCQEVLTEQVGKLTKSLEKTSA